MVYSPLVAITTAPSITQAKIPYRLESDALITAQWPNPRPESAWEQEAVAWFSLVQDIVRSIRNLRAERNVKPGRRISAYIAAGKQAGSLQAQAATIAALAQLDENTLSIHESTPGRMEGYVALHTNRYSVPITWIGRRVEVRETRDKIEIQLDARNLATHARVAEAEHQRILLAQHRPPRGQGIARTQPHPEEKAILDAAPELAEYVAAAGAGDL